MSIIKFNEDPTPVRLSRAQGNSVEGKWGTQYVWECGGGDDIFYASEQFNALLNALALSEGDSVKIKKVPKTDINGKEWSVFAVDTGDGLYKTLDDIKVQAEAPAPVVDIQINQEPLGEITMSTPPIVEDGDIMSGIVERLAKIEKHLGLLEESSVTDEDIPF